MFVALYGVDAEFSAMAFRTHQCEASEGAAQNVGGPFSSKPYADPLIVLLYSTRQLPRKARAVSRCRRVRG
jgi:hypothetical protein